MTQFSITVRLLIVVIKEVVIPSKRKLKIKYIKENKTDSLK